MVGVPIMLLKFTVVGSGIARGCYRGSGLWVVAVVLVVRLMVVARVVSMTPVCMLVLVDGKEVDNLRMCAKACELMYEAYPSLAEDYTLWKDVLHKYLIPNAMVAICDSDSQQTPVA